jgi:hypothetical protein
MSIIQKLATSVGRRDEVPNQELAAAIVGKNDKKAVAELVENLTNNNKAIRSDCIKVLYEIGEAKPKLLAEHYKALLNALESHDNRIQWGAMTALGTIALENPDEIFKFLAKIIDIADRGSVITRDHCVNILIKLTSLPKFADKTFPLLNEQLLGAPTNQLPMYAENAAPVISEKYRDKFVKTLTSRLSDIEKESKRKRVEKVIKKLK